MLTGGVPEHSPSIEAIWLADHYADLADHDGVNLDGQWVAVVGQEVVDHDTDPAAFVERVNSNREQGTALFASIRSDRLA